MPDVRTIHVFIASPGDLPVERRGFKDVIDDLNSGFGDGAGVKFVPLEYIEEVRKAREEAEQQRKLADAALKRLKARKKPRPKGKAAEQRQNQSKAEAKLAAARAEELALLLAEQAAKAALDGRVEEARQLFAKAHTGTTELRVLYLAYSFYLRTGDLTAAEQMLERWLAISGRDAESADTAAAQGNLGVIYKTRGDLDRAEEMHKKALAIDEKLGRQEGMAADYVNLGLIAKDRGNFETARELWSEARELYAKIGISNEVQKIEGWLGSLQKGK
jgi:tetratricopeptide (TPR) repeat protein